MSPELVTIRAAIEVAERIERERDDARCEVDKLARENSALCDDVEELRRANEDLREKLAEIGTKYARLLEAQEGKAA